MGKVLPELNGKLTGMSFRVSEGCIAEVGAGAICHSRRHLVAGHCLGRSAVTTAKDRGGNTMHVLRGALSTSKPVDDMFFWVSAASCS